MRVVLAESSRRVVDIARDLHTSEQTIYASRREDRIDRGVEAGTPTAEHAGLIHLLLS